MDTKERLKVAREELKAAKVAAADERRQEIARRREAEQAEREAHKNRMAEEYLLGRKKAVTDLVYDRAWEDGHSQGFDVVEWHYDDLANLIIAVEKEMAA